MNKLILTSLCCGLLFSSNMLYAQNQHINTATIPTGLQQHIAAEKYDPFKIDVSALLEQFENAGNTPESSVLVSLPFHNGEKVDLYFYKNTCLSKELQEQFPDIITLTGFNKQNQLITAKVDFTKYGFRAMIIDPSVGTYFIDPYSLNNQEYYMGYLKTNLDRTQLAQGICGVDHQADEPIKNTPINITTPPSTLQFSRGNARKKLKLAVACTGEYANTVTSGQPSVNNVLSVIISTVNRCNGFFEREISMTLELIGATTSTIYLNGETDPYSGTDGEKIEQNQETMDVKYPNPLTYDIGHLFEGSGGGLAQLASVCSGGKARAIAGTTNASDIGVIIHEMGHQMSANHTFNANTGGCQGNGNESTAYEPGSGTSVMSYNGLCAPNDLPTPTVDYYHNHTLKEIGTFLQAIPCGVNINGFQPVSIMPLGQSYNVPLNTPYELAASGITSSEPTSNILYSWEQYNLGNFGGTEAQAAGWDAGPSFQSKVPTMRYDRQFPSNSIVANNTYTDIGERTSTVVRDAEYKLTTRSIFEGWGTYNVSDDMVTVKVVNSPPFRVTFPDQSATYEVGSTQEIKWNVASTDQQPILCNFVNIYMSLDGGQTFDYIIVTNAPNTGSYNYTVPDVGSEQIRFKVKGSGNIFYDMTKVDITVNGTFTNIDDINNIKNLSIFPNPTKDYVQIQNQGLVKKPLQVTIANMVGQTVYRNTMTQSLKIDVQNFAAGTYFLQVVDSENNQKLTEKIIKQ